MFISGGCSSLATRRIKYVVSNEHPVIRFFFKLKIKDFIKWLK